MEIENGNRCTLTTIMAMGECDFNTKNINQYTISPPISNDAYFVSLTQFTILRLRFAKGNNICFETKTFNTFWINGFQLRLAFKLESLSNFFHIHNGKTQRMKNKKKYVAASNKYKRVTKREKVAMTSNRFKYFGRSLFQKKRKKDTEKTPTL